MNILPDKSLFTEVSPPILGASMTVGTHVPKVWLREPVGCVAIGNIEICGDFVRLEI